MKVEPNTRLRLSQSRASVLSKLSQNRLGYLFGDIHA
jgi:hypothetical protein